MASPRGPLFVHYPEIDLRIVRVDPRTGRSDVALYPDLWQPDVRAVRDFAVNGQRLFALLSGPPSMDDALLYVVDLDQGQLHKRMPVAPAPRVLAWGTGGQLLVGHFTPAPNRKATAPTKETDSDSSARGHLSVVDSTHLRTLTRVALDGSCISMTADDTDVFLIERIQCREASNDAFAAYQLVHVDVNQGAVKRRMPLPAGARQVVIGPTGLLYVTHASGVGLHATDGTLSVVDPHRWEIIDRLRTDMVVRRVAVLSDRMIFNMLSRSGEAWFGVVLPDHSTLYDFRFGELVTGELAVMGSTAFLPLRGSNDFAKVSMGRNPRVERTNWKPHLRHSDRPGLIRTVVATGGSTDAPR